ncbi:hypothetical protein [Stenotrophomonas sp.]|uniref:hypothetical protein n=1 Tax=Stenotrophomonas sp. TaxID=69392 RepID=UPI0031CEAE0C
MELELRQQLEHLQDRVDAYGFLLEQLLSTLPPEKRAHAYEQAKQSLLLHPRSVKVSTAIDSIRLRAP